MRDPVGDAFKDRLAWYEPGKSYSCCDGSMSIRKSFGATDDSPVVKKGRDNSLYFRGVESHSAFGANN